MILPNNEVMLTFKDVKNINDQVNTFTRYIGRSEYYFVDGILELKINPWKISYLEDLKWISIDSIKEIEYFNNSFKDSLHLLDSKYPSLFNLNNSLA
jgi:hypothetical protein